LAETIPFFGTGDAGLIPITNSVRARAGHAGQGPVPKALAGVAGGYTGYNAPQEVQ
jgi:hypothetical protein